MTTNTEVDRVYAIVKGRQQRAQRLNTLNAQKFDVRRNRRACYLIARNIPLFYGPNHDRATATQLAKALIQVARESSHKVRARTLRKLNDLY